MQIKYEPGDKVYLPDELAERFYIIKTINRRAAVLELAEQWREEPTIVRGIDELSPTISTTEKAKIIN